MKLMDLLNEGEEKRPLSNEVKKHFLEIVSTYNKYQEMMDRKSDIAEIAETLGGITEAAKTLAIHEGDDWFDKHTIKRNMSELDKLGKAFDKCAVEAKSLDQRLNGLYEDMGHILSRYYKMGEISEEQMRERLGMNESVNEETHQVQLSPKGNHIVNIKEADDLNEEEMKLYELGCKVETLMEKNCPTDASKWSYYKGQAKKKFDVYPSAYANGWAAKQYKSAGGSWKQCANESVNEATLKQGTKLRYDKNNFVVDYVVDKKYTGKDGFPKYTLKVVKSNFPNKIKVGSTEEYEDSKLTGLIRNKVMNFVKNESVTEDKSEVEKIAKQVGKNEIKFYDALSKVEKRLGSKYPKFLDTALKQLKQNPSSLKTNADKEEAIFQSVK